MLNSKKPMDEESKNLQRAKVLRHPSIQINWKWENIHSTRFALSVELSASLPKSTKPFLCISDVYSYSLK